MKKKKNVLVLLACVALVLLAFFTIRCVKMYQRENDPYWQIAKEIYNVQQALKAEDEDWELESLSSVTPYCYTYEDGSIIMYYHCTTTYLGEELPELEGLNTTALSQAVDVESLEKSRECKVNGWQAIIGELEGKTYLCWTLDSKNSCVIEYTAGEFVEEDIFRMAESVQKQKEE